MIDVTNLEVGKWYLFKLPDCDLIGCGQYSTNGIGLPGNSITDKGIKEMLVEIRGPIIFEQLPLVTTAKDNDQ